MKLEMCMNCSADGKGSIDTRAGKGRLATCKHCNHFTWVFPVVLPNTAWSRLVKGSGILPAVVNQSNVELPE